MITRRWRTLFLPPQRESMTTKWRSSAAQLPVGVGWMEAHGASPRTFLPPSPRLSVVALWGLMNYFLQSAPRYKSSLVPSALWAAKHRAGAGGVCGVVSDTERVPPERKGPGSSLSPVKAETWVAHVDGSHRPPGAAGGSAACGGGPSARLPTGAFVWGEGGGRVGAKKIAPEELGAGCREPSLFRASPGRLATCLRAGENEKYTHALWCGFKMVFFLRISCVCLRVGFSGVSWLGDVSYPFKR